MQVDLLSSLQAKPILIDWLNLIQFLVFTQKVQFRVQPSFLGQKQIFYNECLQRKKNKWPAILLNHWLEYSSIFFLYNNQ